MNDRLYLLKIRLLDIEPEIWRRFVVPGSITLDRLHDVIQIVMGWEDYHLHAFTIGKKRYTENPEFKDDGAHDGRFRLLIWSNRKGGHLVTSMTLVTVGSMRSRLRIADILIRS